MDRSVVTLNRFIVEQERKHPRATGSFSDLLQDLTLAAKLVHRAVTRAGLVADDILGETGDRNVHDERVKKLDAYAHEVMVAAMDHGGHLCVMGSEEAEGLVPIPERFPLGEYVLLFDPLDGSTNIDANISVGTIFSIHRRVSDPGDGAEPGGLADCLQAGHRQLAAGYVLYGSSTMLVYTTGDGVHGFTLDPSLGEFVLSHPDIRMPEPGRRIYSVNEGHRAGWDEGQRALVERLKDGDGGGDDGFTGRYVGSMVADVHRTLLYGGLFMYPASDGSPSGKLRLLYEAAPMARVVVEAGGAATDGRRPILEIEPEELHQRTPLYLGNRDYVDLARGYLDGETG